MMTAGTRVIATHGPRAGQKGRIIEPTGVEISWVKWARDVATTYPHRSLKEA